MYDETLDELLIEEDARLNRLTSNLLDEEDAEPSYEITAQGINDFGVESFLVRRAANLRSAL